MVDPSDIQGKARVLSRLLERKMGARGRDLAARRRKAGRRLPRKVRRAVLEVERAEIMARHPKVGLRMDPGEIDRAYRQALTHLEAVDPNDRLKGYVLGVLGVNAVNFSVIAAALVALAVWRGWV